MAYRISWKVTSKKHPDKTYHSTAEFWQDHNDDDGIGDEFNIIDDVENIDVTEMKNSSNLNARYIAEGKLLSDDTEIGEDGKHMIYTKVYSDKETYLKYLEDFRSIPNVEAGEENTITMVKIKEEEIYLFKF
tara:strand:+ start:1084 stop:1479 length:396 start_codon:yes stop_codon:yes gene_type:complete